MSKAFMVLTTNTYYSIQAKNFKNYILTVEGSFSFKFLLDIISIDNPHKCFQKKAKDYMHHTVDAHAKVRANSSFQTGSHLNFLYNHYIIFITLI